MGEKGGRRRGCRWFTWLPVLAGVLLLAVPAGAYFIEIDPIGDKGVGDKFTITASTDLGVGEEVLVTVYAMSFVPTQKTQSGEFSGVSGSTVVTPGGGQLNRISFDVDAATFKPDEYMVTMEAIMQGITGYARFNVVEKVLVDYFITINTIGDRYVGDRVTITASTNLPQGEDVVLTVTSPSFSLTRSGKVTTGGGGVNRVSYYLDTSAWSPDTYDVHAQASAATSPTILFRLLQTVTPSPPITTVTTIPTTVPGGGGVCPKEVLLAGGVVAGLAGAMVVGTKVLRGRAAAQAARPAVRSDVRLEVRRGMEVEEMDLEKAGIRLDVEAGIETSDETIEGGSG